jgi:hypothetical protein
VILILSSQIGAASAWSNGGFSSNPSNPDYGTHDWIAQHALDWLPAGEKQYITNNLAVYLYGTELPDNSQAADGIGDTTKHHIYFRSGGALQDDSAATRASAEYSNAMSSLKQGDYTKAAKYVGIMSHYIADMAVFGHVMGSDTDWGAEKHHSDYEDYVQTRTSSYASSYFALTFDGSLTSLSAYDAARSLSYNTTFGSHGSYGASWMDADYDWNNPAFRSRCNESLNLAVNLICDVLRTIYLDAEPVQAYLPGVSTPMLVGAGVAVTAVVILALALRGSGRARRSSRRQRST